MSDSISSADLVLYLAKLKKNYLSGIPIPAGKPKEERPYVISGAQKPGSYLFVYFDDSESFDFLKALVEKGLKQQIAQQSFLAVNKALFNGEKQRVAEYFTGILSEIKFKAALVFDRELARVLTAGGENADPQAVEVKYTFNTNVVIAPGISKLASDAQLKRTFWHKLKEL